MIAINLTGKQPTKRQKLIDLLPLEAPLVVQIFPIYSCNFKCNYCVFQIPVIDRHFISNQVKMEFKDFVKSINDMKKFKNKIKVIRFVGIGEPLLHNELHKMIAYTKKSNVCEKIELITNGYLLSRFKTLELIGSGLDRIVISIQGLTTQQYNKNCGLSLNRIDFEWFINNLRFLYRAKKQCDIYIKAVDSVLPDQIDKKNFYTLFGDICDYIAIETTVPIHQGVELKERDTTQFGHELKEVNICPQPFFHLQINPDMAVVPCYSFEYPEIIGNLKSESFYDVWNGKKLNNFRKKLINSNKNKTCKECNIIKYRMHDEDNLCKNIMEKVYL